MSAESKKRILFVVLNWGLGHATRSIPIIRFLARTNEVIIASNGRSLKLLNGEFSNLRSIKSVDYGIYISSNRLLVIPLLGLQIPKIIVRMIQEYLFIRKVVKKYRIDLIVSDCCYGAVTDIIPTYFLTHQLRYSLPPFLQRFEFLSEWFNHFFFKFYERIFVLDTQSDLNLTGKLAHSKKFDNDEKLVFLGIFSDITKTELESDIDVFISISGPELARTAFEQEILSQIANLKGKIIVTLGKPERARMVQKIGQAKIYSYFNREKMNEFMNRAKLIICRSGYTTIMELVALQKSAILIPTPGQTEQEYLAQHLKNQGLFQVANQKNLDLERVIDQKVEFQTKISHGIPVNNMSLIKKYF